MTIDETKNILAVLEANYSESISRLSDTVKTNKLKLWHKMFIDDEYKTVGMAVHNYMANDTWGKFPVLGAIKEEVRKILFPLELTEQEAVNIIMDRIQWRSSKVAYDSLPEVLKRVVGSHHQLSTWGYMEFDTVQSVISSNIQRSLRTILTQEREKQRTGQVKPVVEPERLIEQNEEPKHIEKKSCDKEEMLKFIKKAMAANNLTQK